MRRTLPRARLLFVAHCDEILDQSLGTFRQSLRDHAFGEKWVAGLRPRDFEHVFASIQSLHATGLASLDPRHFDVVIVDEFHHAAAPSYAALLEHVQPVELLGLTATPERSDGLPVLQRFDHRIAAELRLWDAIDQHRLSPFAYYGIHDGLDLRDVSWKRGRGYDVDGLTKVLTATDAWVRGVLAQVGRHVDDAGRMRALGFCVSVQHAQFMARVFRAAGMAAVAIWGDSPEAERRAALADLDAGRVQVVFSVDLFNEGIDVPAVDTLLLLRPTDSPTLFLQQLGRGLRRAPGKTVCTVLDFVGRHRAEFRFDRRFRALLGGSRADLVQQIEGGFPFLPTSCQMGLDRVSAAGWRKLPKPSLYHRPRRFLRRHRASSPRRDRDEELSIVVIKVDVELSKARDTPLSCRAVDIYMTRNWSARGSIERFRVNKTTAQVHDELGVVSNPTAAPRCVGPPGFRIGADPTVYHARRRIHGRRLGCAASISGWPPAPVTHRASDGDTILLARCQDLSSRDRPGDAIVRFADLASIKQKTLTLKRGGFGLASGQGEYQCPKKRTVHSTAHVTAPCR